MHRGELEELPHPSKTPLSVVILLADGARPDTLDAAVRSGALPALARLRDEGGMHTITSCFPSVTGPAYAPFLMGRFPGPIGLPGLRWFDRARDVCTFPDYTRSYVGYQMSSVDRDIAADAPTIFELCDGSIGALNVIGRGLPVRDRIGSITAASALRAARTHFAGNVAGWLQIDRDVATQVTRRVRDGKPEFVFAALTGVDKVSHARGHESPMIMDALRIVDDTAAQIRADAERAGRWEDMSLWVVSDHGHSRVTNARGSRRHRRGGGTSHRVASVGFHSIARSCRDGERKRDGAHLCGRALAAASRATRSARGGPRCSTRCSRAPSVDIALVPGARDVVIYGGARGRATAWLEGDRYSYRRDGGDPLGIGRDLDGVSADEAYDATIDTDYPDGIVQIVHLARSPRSGEIILSAARDWDFRAHYEPIPHVSSHGALHREHMLVPLLVNRPIERTSAANSGRDAECARGARQAGSAGARR